MLTFLLAAALTTAPLEKITSTGFDMPKRPDKDAPYVIYVHGRVIENHRLRPRDERFGTSDRDPDQGWIPADHITVIGASKGAVIAMLVSTLVDNPRVRYVVMSNCNEWVPRREVG